MPPRKNDVPDHIDRCGVRMWYCSGPGHEERTLLPADQFQFVRRPVANSPGDFYSYRRTICKHCTYVQRSTRWKTFRDEGARQYAQHGRVSLEHMLPYLEELEARCGGANAAARRLGYSSGVIFLRWMGRTAADPDRTNRYMMRESAIKVLLTLREVRAVQKGDLVEFRPGRYTGQNGNGVRARRRARCSGCGTRWENLTEGCKSCWERHSNWNQAGKNSLGGAIAD